ncbi:MAG: DoxX family protein [Bacteroidales bacterium]|nr:DoxX family protein [Bacteroidales bacterium]
MKTLITLSRSILALVFLFSGFVKGVDPLGTAYKIEDYLIAYGMDWALPISLIIAFCLIALEMSLGILLAFNILPKFTRGAMAGLMFFFTFVTLYDALYNPVPDCGCFGDALVITNWQTFYKNILLDVLILALFFNHPKKVKVRKHLSWGLAVFILFLSFSFYNLRHLPMIDFRFWKVGSQVYNNKQKSIELYLTFKNKNTGELHEFLSPNYPYQDKEWNANWEFVSSREYSPEQNAQSLMIFDIEGIDVTNEVLGVQGKSFLLISHDLNAISKKNVQKIKTFIQIAEDENLSIAIITASLGNKIFNFSNQNTIDIPFFLADDIDLKTIIRSNPGLILLENGKVIKKWASADIPSSSDNIYD